MPRLDLERRVLWASEQDRRGAPYACRRHEPASSIGHEHEQPIAPLGAELLDDAVPALTPAAGRETDPPAAVAMTIGVVRRRLDLHSVQPLAVVGHEVAVAGVPEREIDVVAVYAEPLRGRVLPKVALLRV
jgi:hypothetical protein